MMALVVFLVVLVGLDIAALRFGVNSRDDRPESVTAERGLGKLLL